jgi:hypothetical protein
LKVGDLQMNVADTDFWVDGFAHGHAPRRFRLDFNALTRGMLIEHPTLFTQLPSRDILGNRASGLRSSRKFAPPSKPRYIGRNALRWGAWVKEVALHKRSLPLLLGVSPFLPALLGGG